MLNLKDLPLLVLYHIHFGVCYDWTSINLVKSHVPYVLSHHPNIKQLCLEDAACPYKEFSKQKNHCWGFEKDCSSRFGSSHLTRDCNSENSKARYWYQADFGYLANRLNEMKSRVFCKSKKHSQSSLSCTKDSTMCQAQNLYIDLRKVYERIDRRDKVHLQDGEIGGYCTLDQDILSAETMVKRDLSTWGEQLGPYRELDFDPFSDTESYCDVLLKEPVIFVQLDFGGNMYHHFCDFFNLYLTQMANNSWFGTDVQIIRWDMSPRYGELFESSWKVFTSHQHVSLREYAGKRVCIPHATFAFLPRMAFGLFYSTPLEENCRGSSLFQAFSEHFLFRMGITDEENIPVSAPAPPPEKPDRIRVTILDRGFTTRYQLFRRILNQNELVEALHKIDNLDVQVVKYSGDMAFEEQLRITRGTDIFIGMHGAGLAHFLFLPDWAVAFELYNCGDIRCYRDLARLRGLRYMTWEDNSKLTEHDKDVHERYSDNAKFWNFKFDVDEFVRLVSKAKSWLLEHPKFSHLQGRKDEL